MQQLSRAMGSVDSLVNHGIAELQGGASAEHVLREVALMGALVGAGMSAGRAVRSVEAAESRLLGGVERAEAGYHTGAGGTAYGAMRPWGARMGMGMPTGQWGTSAGMMGAYPGQYGTMGAYPSQYGTMGAYPGQFGTMGVPGQLGTMGAYPGQFGTMGVPGTAMTYGMASGQPTAMFIMPVGTTY